MTSPARRVLSVQSHVVHGYVGNRAATFPLQLLGFDVDCINSVQFSCHKGYPSAPGQILNGDDLRTLAQGLADNQLLNHGHLITGFIGSVSFLREVMRLRQMMPSTSRWICDPVLGDNGKLYVTEELVDVYRNEVLPHATILTPNQFEAEKLGETEIRTMAEAAAVCDKLHRLGPRMIVLTTLDTPDATKNGEVYAMMLSEAGRQKWLLQLPRIEGGPFTGTGDLTASMLLAWTQLYPNEAPAALEIVGSVLQAVIRETVKANSATLIAGKRVAPELRLIESKRLIEDPHVEAYCSSCEPRPEIRGVLFDMDGTLTLPGALDLSRIRERTGVPPGVDVVPYLREKHASDEAGLAAAMAIIDEEERASFNPPQLRPGLRESIEHIRALGVPMGIFTRNSAGCVEDLVRHAELPPDVFSPIVTRDSAMPNKPDPAPVLHCCETWGVEPAAVLVVGDGLDDIRSGRAAGSKTAAMLKPGPAGTVDAAKIEASAAGANSEEAIVQLADYALSSVAGLKRFFL